MSCKSSAIELLVEFFSVCLSITWMVAGLSQRLLAERFAVTTSVSSLFALFCAVSAVAAETAPTTNNGMAESTNDPRVMVCCIVNPMDNY
ncbi:Uncharacterised protein [Kluyvera cryocrescens]|uniref:Uncharacterized protein n=1 Tax=Kluyvera cryocrescens TaxID=580 RepID=A0A485ASN5_KLUCR|nr:Uncharacterised protein [Kluyvera cryocrescens]